MRTRIATAAKITLNIVGENRNTAYIYVCIYILKRDKRYVSLLRILARIRPHSRISEVNLIFVFFAKSHYRTVNRLTRYSKSRFEFLMFSKNYFSGKLNPISRVHEISRAVETRYLSRGDVLRLSRAILDFSRKIPFIALSALTNVSG